MEFVQKLLWCFLMFRVWRNARHGAQLHTLRLVKVADAFCAFVGVDHIRVLAQGNGRVRAHRLTDITVDALLCNHQGHGPFSLSSNQNPLIIPA